MGFKNLQICDQNYRPLRRQTTGGLKGIPIPEPQEKKLLKVGDTCVTVSTVIQVAEEAVPVRVESA